MGKSSLRRPLRYEKHQGGCISGLMSIFDFRHDRSNRKLITGRRQGSSRQTGSTPGSSSSRCNSPKYNDKHEDITEDEESGTAKVCAVKASVKELMEEEMINEPVPQKQIGVARLDSQGINAEQGSRIKKRHKKKNRSSVKSVDMDVYNWDNSRNLDHQNLGRQINDQNISDDIDVETIIKELFQIHYGSSESIGNDLNDYSEMHPDQDYTAIQEKLSAAIEVFMSQTLHNSKHSRKDGTNPRSKEVMDAFETISSYKDLFSKLLQDPNSQLVKQIKGLEGAKSIKKEESNNLPVSHISEEVSNKSESIDPINRKHKRFFRRRSNSQEKYPFEGDNISHSPSEIVILKPGPAAAQCVHNENIMTTSLHSHDFMDNKIKSGKSASNFSFAEIRRRLKHAVGKERHEISSKTFARKVSAEHINRGANGKRVCGASFGWSSPNRDHFYTERFAKPSSELRKVDKIDKSKEVEATIVNESSTYHKQGASNLYIEAKRHLSEMVNNEEANVELMRKQLSNPLGRVLSLPEYKDVERRSPEKDTEDSFLTARMKLSPSKISRTGDDKTHQLFDQKHNGNLISSEESIDNPTYLTEANHQEDGQSPDANHANPGAMCKVMCDHAVDESTPEGTLDIDQTTKATGREEEISTTPTSDDVDDNEALCNEQSSSECFELRSLEEGEVTSSPPASPSFSSENSKVEDADKAIGSAGRPSPISVLDSLISEDDISPPSSMHQKVQQQISPRKIHFEEQMPSSICMDDDEEVTPFDYVEALLLGSDLNWDEYLLKWLDSDQILDPSLIDEVELLSNRRHDQKLLFDCTNGVLKDVCDRYFGHFIGMSAVNQRIQPVPRGMDLIHEIWEGVKWHLLQYPEPISSDQLVKKDVTKSGMWRDLHLEVKHIGTEMQEAIFQELVEDTISSFVHDNLERTSINLPAEAYKTEISITA